LSYNNTQNIERNPKKAPHLPCSYQKEYVFIPKTRLDPYTEP
jgi:hypothetical protein